MTQSDQNLVLVLAAATVLSFVLMLVGADVGASEQNILSALCSVAVLGAMTFTLAITARRTE
jgi:uncharacterized membrane protein YhaH (DUF805 family)